MISRTSAIRVLILLALVPVFPKTGWAQTADEVVEKHLAALGGREALGKLTSRHATGTVTLSTPGGDIGGAIELFLKAPNKTRVVMNLDLSAVGGSEMAVEQKFDGTSASMYNSMQGETPITGSQVENMRNSLFPTPLLHYKDNGAKVELQPKEKVGDKDAIVLVLTPKSGSAARLILDPETYLIMRTVTTVNTNGQDMQQTSELSDYRTVDGVKVAFQVINSNPAQSIRIVLKSVEHNVAMDDAAFGKK